MAPANMTELLQERIPGIEPGLGRKPHDQAIWGSLANHHFRGCLNQGCFRLGCIVASVATELWLGHCCLGQIWTSLFIRTVQAFLTSRVIVGLIRQEDQHVPPQGLPPVSLKEEEVLLPLLF